MTPESSSSSRDSGAIARLRRAFRGTLVWYGFVLPPLFLILVFIGYPTAIAFEQSVFTQVPGGGQKFAGTFHFERLVTDRVFWGALANTILLGVAFLVIIIPLATILASMLNRVRRGATPLKVIYFLPQLTSSVAIAIMFNYVFQPDWGLLNGALRALGVTHLPLWLADPRYDLTGSRAAATILAVWAGLGYFIIIVLAGLQSIPNDLFDAAAIDGASPLQSWWYVTLPSLKPTFIFLIITGSIDQLARFSDLWTLGGPGGSPARSLQSIVMYIFQQGFVGSDFSLAAAAAVVFFMIVLVVTTIAFWGFLRREFTAVR
ncbi:MAG TPA: sugar ABC transporter permease [Devosia sp.]|jgi:ABC-type sugar transport system permease subunit|nr:sugar ABC transporter permease [Devosia sp.]